MWCLRVLACEPTPEDVVLVVLVGLCAHFDQTGQTFSVHKLMHQVLIVLGRAEQDISVLTSHSDNVDTPLLTPNRTQTERVDELWFVEHKNVFSKITLVQHWMYTVPCKGTVCVMCEALTPPPLTHHSVCS